MSNTSCMRTLGTGLLPLLVCVIGVSLAQADEAAIRPSPVFPWHWEFQGKPTLLVGGSDDDNLFQWPDELLRAQLDLLASMGGNYVRNTMSDRHDKGFELYPFLRLDSGKYDLDQWNPEYWQRFDRFLKWTGERGIIVQIEIWDRFDYTDNRGADRWQKHPYHPRNNMNYSAEESGFADRYPDHPGTNRQPFFFTTPEQRNNEVILKYQRRFVDKMLSYSLKQGHVLYCIDNETNGEEAWATYWAQFLHTRASAAGKSIFVTEMWDDWNLKADRHKRTFDHPERYAFVDISQNNHNKGDQHWSNALSVRNYLAKQPRPMNTVKTYGADGNKFGHSDDDGIERVWRHLLAGCAAVRFHRPDSGLGLSVKAQASIRAIRLVESLIPFWEVEPHGDLLSNRQQNGAYAASQEGRAYLVYFPKPEQVTLSLVSGSYDLTWIDTTTGTAAKPKPITATSALTLKSPPQKHQVAVLTRRAE